MKVETFTLNKERNVTLTAYIQAVGGEYSPVEERPAVMVIPGGGYHICSDREAEPVALAFLKAGYDAFVLRYSVTGDNNERPGNADWPNPLRDYEQAMRFIREKAEEWHVIPEKICIIGFSAGGHLAGAGMTMAAPDARPNAAILGYPVDKWPEGNKYGIVAPTIHPLIKKDNCPCFIFAARDDDTVPVANSIDLMKAMYDNEVPFESHIYRHGPHGFGTCDSWLERRDFCPRVPTWVEDSIAWLNETFEIFL